MWKAYIAMLDSLAKDDPRRSVSYWQNPACKYGRSGCSESIGSAPDICFYHEVAVGSPKTTTCGCKQEWKYFDQEDCNVYESINAHNLHDSEELCASPFKCCDADDFEFACGAMQVCNSCRYKHMSTYKLKLYKRTYLVPPQSDVSFTELVVRHDRYGRMTDPRNQLCKLKSVTCSEAMSFAQKDLCFWHSRRMGTKKEYRCGCSSKWWPVVTGDSPGRNLVREYYGLDYDTTPTIDSSGQLYCCGPASSGATSGNFSTCGSMLVCENCRIHHVSVDPLELEEEEPEDQTSSFWPHRENYEAAIITRIAAGQKIMYADVTPEGIQFILRDQLLGSLCVYSASTALVAAGRNPTDADWWIWIAGWYDDCPQSIPKHI